MYNSPNPTIFQRQALLPILIQRKYLKTKTFFTQIVKEQCLTDHLQLVTNDRKKEKTNLISRMNICSIFQQQLDHLLSVLLAGNMERGESILKGKKNHKSCLLPLNLSNFIYETMFISVCNSEGQLS